MLSVYQLAVPTPYPSGPVNILIIKNDPVTLIDSGPGTPAAKRILRNALRSLTIAPAEVKRILISHSHSDHCGLADWFCDAGRAKVYAHPHALRHLTEKIDYVQERIPHMIQCGLPPGALSEILAAKDPLPNPVLKSWDTRPLSGGERILFDGGSLEVLHLPGHSPGHLCFFAPGQGYFFSGDLLLPYITPNPLLEPDPADPTRRMPVLQHYFASIEAVSKMNIKLVWPGHGGAFNDFKSIIERGYAHHQKQFELIQGILSAGRKNCYEVTRLIYPSLKGWNIFMGVSEVQAHLDYLVDTGRLQNEIDTGVAYYWNTGG